MKKNFINKVHVEGLLYQHNLKKKVTGENAQNPGTEYITGTVEIATDNDILNIVSVFYAFVTAKTKNGKDNSAFKVLSDIIDGKLGSVMANGADAAVKLAIDSAIGLNDFYTDRSGKEELVSAKRNEGGFISIINELNPDEKLRSTFATDMVITSVTHKDADEEKQLPEKAVIRGVIFNYNKAILPVEFSAINPNAIAYFEGLDISPKNPCFTEVRGRQISETIVKSITEESAFGEPSVKEVKNSHKDFVITWARPEIYEWDSEETITAAELSEAKAARETYLATIKQKNDEYKASKAAQPAAFAPATNAGFEF